MQTHRKIRRRLQQATVTLTAQAASGCNLLHGHAARRTRHEGASPRRRLHWRLPKRPTKKGKRKRKQKSPPARRRCRCRPRATPQLTDPQFHVAKQQCAAIRIVPCALFHRASLLRRLLLFHRFRSMVELCLLLQIRHQRQGKGPHRENKFVTCGSGGCNYYIPCHCL